jgi:hypothetical protein
MLCLYCREKIPTNSRALGSFCSIAHRSAYYQRSIRRSGLSRNLGAFQLLSPTVGVHEAHAGHPHNYASSIRFPGAWHLSSVRARGVPAAAGFSARLAEAGAIAPARRQPATPALSPIQIGGCVIPGAPEGSQWKVSGPWIPLGALAGLIPESAIPPVRIWEAAGSANALRGKRDRTQLSGSGGLHSRLQGLRLSPEKTLAPLYYALESTSRDAAEWARRPVRVALRRDHWSSSLQALPERKAPPVIQESVSTPRVAAPVSRVEIQEPQPARIHVSKEIARQISKFEFRPTTMFPQDRLFRPGLEPSVWHSFRPTRPELIETGDARLDSWHRTSSPIARRAIPEGASLLTVAKSAPLLSAPRLAAPSRIEALPGWNPMGRVQLHDSHPAPWAGVRMSVGIPQDRGFLERPPATVRSVRYRFLVPSPLPSILEVPLPSGRAGGTLILRAPRLRFHPSSIDAAIRPGEPRSCREQMLAILPDLIHTPHPVHVFGEPRLRVSIPAVALHTGFDPWAVSDFLRLRHCISHPPLFTESRHREFPLRPAIRCAAIPSQVSLGEAGPVTSKIRHLPDSPANLVFPKKISVNGRGLTVAGLHLPVDTRVAPFSRHAIAAPAATQGRMPERLSNLAFAKRISVNSRGLTVAALHLPADSKAASIARRAIKPLPPAEGRPTSGEVFSKSWVSSDRIVYGSGPLVHLFPPAPVGAAFATILPPQASWSSVLEGLHERIFSPYIKSNLRLRFGEPDLKTHKTVLPIAKLPVPLDFRWQREPKQWDRAARWKRRRDSLSLPTISFCPEPSSPTALLEGVVGTSTLGHR